MTLGFFLQNLTLTDEDLFLGAFLGLLGAFAVFVMFFLLALYIYTSLAYYSIARKAKLRNPGISWIPIVGPLVIANKSSRMHWWPWLLIVLFFIPIFGFVANITFTVFSVIWRWKMFEHIKKPNWWAILTLIPIVNLVIIGLAAWGKD